MDEAERQMHLRAGLAYGQKTTCGSKQDFRSERTATKVAPRLSAKFEHTMEAYPCVFCSGWHVGREMTAEERVEFSIKTPCSRDTNGDGDCGRLLCPECGIFS